MLAARRQVVVGRFLEIAGSRRVAELRHVVHVDGGCTGGFGRTLLGNGIQRLDQGGFRSLAIPAPAGGGTDIDRAQMESLRTEQLRSLDEASKRLVTAFGDAAEVLSPEQRAAALTEKETHELCNAEYAVRTRREKAARAAEQKDPA